MSSVATGYLGYASAIITGVAWPIAIVALAFAFRRRLSELSGKLEKLVFPGGEAHFHHKLPEAEATAAKAEVAIEAMTAPVQTDADNSKVEVELEPENAVQPPAPRREYLLESPDEILLSLLNLNPALAVNHAWTGIRGQIKAVSRHVPEPMRTSVQAVLSYLRQRHLIPDEAVSLYLRLSQLSAVAESGGAVSTDDAYRFISTAKVLQRALDGVNRL